MASYSQMVAHYDQLAQQQSQQTDDQIRMAREQAALQAQRDAQLSAEQQAQQFQQQRLAAQREQLQAGYGQQAQVLGAGLQQQRDILGHQVQLEQMGVGAQIQAQHAEQQSGLRQRETEHGANIQAQLAQVQLNQQEEMRLRRLQQAVSHTDEQAASGYLSPEEAAQLKTQLVTGLNPLQNRAIEADRLRSLVQTQGLFQQNDQHAQLFNRQQAIRAMNPEQRIREFTDGNGNRATFQLTADGDWTPLDFNASARADQASSVNTARAASDINTQTQMLPANLAHVGASTSSLNANTEIARAESPGRIALNAANTTLTNTHVTQINNAIEQGNLTAESLRGLTAEQTAEVRQRVQTAIERAPHDLKLLRANVELHSQQARNEPENNTVRNNLHRAQIGLAQAQTTVFNREAAATLPATDRAHMNEELGHVESIIDREVRDAPSGRPSWVGTSEQYRQAVGAQPIPWYQTESEQEKSDRFEYYRAQRASNLSNGIRQRYLGNAPTPQGGNPPATNQPSGQAPPGGGAGNQGGQAAPGGPVNFFNPQTPQHREIVASVASIAEQVEALGPGDEQQRAGEDLDRLIMLTSQYGSTANMPPEAVREYGLIRNRLRQLPTAATSRMPVINRPAGAPERPLWMRVLGVRN